MNGLSLNLLAVILALGWGLFPASAATKKPVILTSFLPLYCFAANVAGENAAVENLLPPGIGPHEYQFSVKDLQKIQKADLIIINGLKLEPWVNRVLQNAKDKPIFEAAAGLEPQFLPFNGTDTAPARNNPNPHLWLDPSLALRMVANIADALKKHDPAHAAAYSQNAAAYSARLEKLDQAIQTALRPCANSAIITFHNAFPYFARRYNLNIAGVIEPVPDVAPSPRHLAALHKTARAQRVQAIFTEPQSASGIATQMGRDLNLPVATLDNLETGPLSPTAYEDGMRKNLQSLLKHLQPSRQTTVTPASPP